MLSILIACLDLFSVFFVFLLPYGQILLMQEMCFELSIFSSASAEVVLISRMSSGEMFTLIFINALLGTRSQKLRFF